MYRCRCQRARENITVPGTLAIPRWAGFAPGSRRAGGIHPLPAGPPFLNSLPSSFLPSYYSVATLANKEYPIFLMLKRGIFCIIENLKYCMQGIVACFFV